MIFTSLVAYGKKILAVFLVFLFFAVLVVAIYLTDEIASAKELKRSAAEVKRGRSIETRDKRAIETSSSSLLSEINLKEYKAMSFKWPPSHVIASILKLVNKNIYYGFDEALNVDKTRSGRRAAHCIFFARKSSKIKALIMMQVRWDGTLGFPGGFLKGNENPVKGLNRELKEELNLNVNRFGVTSEDFLLYQTNKKMSFYLFAKEISPSEYAEIEKGSFDAKDFGYESFGQFRAPVQIFTGSSRGLPSFLRNNFCGTSKAQLLAVLYARKLLGVSEIVSSLRKSEAR